MAVPETFVNWCGGRVWYTLPPRGKPCEEGLPVANVYDYCGPDDTQLIDDEVLRQIAEEARAMAEAEFAANAWEVGYSSGTRGDDDPEHHLHLLRLELGRDLTPAELRDWRAGFAAGGQDRAAFARDLADGVPAGWDDVPF